MSFEYNRDLNPEDGKCKQCGKYFAKELSSSILPFMQKAKY